MEIRVHAQPLTCSWHYQRSKGHEDGYDSYYKSIVHLLCMCALLTPVSCFEFVTDPLHNNSWLEVQLLVSYHHPFVCRHFTRRLLDCWDCLALKWYLRPLIATPFVTCLEVQTSNATRPKLETVDERHLDNPIVCSGCNSLGNGGVGGGINHGGDGSARTR